MTEPGHYTHSEILSQPEAWAAALAVVREGAPALRDFFRSGRFDSILFTGCGSTYYLALSAAAVAQELLGLPARGLPASEIWLNAQSAYAPNGKTLLVAVSRSGETTESLRACEAFRARGHGEVLTLSCYPGRALTQLGAFNLVFPSGQEESVAQTRAFSTLYLAAVALAALWAKRDDLFEELSRLPAAGQSQISNLKSQIQALAHDPSLDRFYFLGSGPRYGLACELSLKMKEMSLSHSEPFHFMEFRHGPKSMVTPSTLIVGLVSESNRAHELAVLDEMRAMGARAHSLALGGRDGEVAFNSGVSETARNVLYLPVGQLLAFERSLHNGLNPDRPNNLDVVVRLDAGAR
jgi:glucosamine--fructose-6-phosphate aminotransferase (isomerizing)